MMDKHLWFIFNTHTVLLSEADILSVNWHFPHFIEELIQMWNTVLRLSHWKPDGSCNLYIFVSWFNNIVWWRRIKLSFTVHNHSKKYLYKLCILPNEKANIIPYALDTIFIKLIDIKEFLNFTCNQKSKKYSYMGKLVIAKMLLCSIQWM